MSIDLDRERLLQKEALEWIQRELNPNKRLTVLKTSSNNSQGCSVYSTLVPLDRVEYHRSHLKDYVPPSALVAFFFGPDGQEITGIDRDINMDQYLIIDRNPGETAGKEICQDFRFFYDLYLSKDTSKYVLNDFMTKEEVLVAVVEPNSVKIRFKELKGFLKSKKLYLSLQFSCSEYSEHSLSELVIPHNEVESGEMELQDGHISWRRIYREAHKAGYQTESVLHARRFIGYTQIPKAKPSGFIICLDEYGNEIRRHPHKLRVAMYERPGWSPNPIFVCFNKEVLDRYYTRDSKYLVGDLSLIWHDDGNVERLLPIDDDHEDYVWVLFSHLALLSNEELAHWEMHNICPDEKPSRTYLNRYVPGMTPTESNRPEHQFRGRYSALSGLCKARLGWDLFFPLNPKDEYRLRSLRVPSSDEQRDFDDLIQSLSTILVDSLNQKDIKKLISAKEQRKLEQLERKPAGIDYFEATLHSCGVANSEKHVSFLRKLQRLRSKGSAHRKGKEYEKQVSKDFGIKNQEYRRGFSEILRQAVACLEFLICIVRRGEFSDKKEIPILYDLNENLHTLLKTLFPSGTKEVFEDETWIDEIDTETSHIANQLATKAIDEFEGSPSEFKSDCENLIVSANPNVAPSDIKTRLTEFSKVFIWKAGGNFRYAMGILSDAQSANVQLTEAFEYTAESSSYCKKLTEYSLAFVNLDEIKDCDWYPYYVAWYLSYASAYTLYAYEHVWHAEGLDSVPVVLDAVFAVQSVADVAEKLVNVDAVREAAKCLVQVAKCESS